MVFGELLKSAALETVQTAVAHVCHIGPSSVKDGQNHRSSHAGQIRMFSRRPVNFLIGGVDGPEHHIANLPFVHPFGKGRLNGF